MYGQFLVNCKTNDRLTNAELQWNYPSLVCIWNKIFLLSFQLNNFKHFP